MLEDSTGALWFGTSRDPGVVTRFDGVTWRNFTAADGMDLPLSIRPLLRDRLGNTWFGSTCPSGLATECASSRSRIARFDGTTWVSYTLPGPIPSDGVWDMIEDHQGTLWAAGDGFFRFDGVQWNRVTPAPPISSVGAMAEDREGRIWVAGYAYLLRFDGMGWTDFTSDVPIDPVTSQRPNFRALALDRDGNLWIATSIGAVRFDGSTWRLFTPADGLVDRRVNAILPDRDGSVWFGTDAGASRLDPQGRWSRVTNASGLAGLSVLALLRDQQGSLWFGTESGVSRWDGDAWKVLTAADGLPANHVRVLEDRNGGFWFLGGDSGVVRYDGVQWLRIMEGSGVPLLANAGARDPQGSLWFGTASGLVRYNPDSSEVWKIYTSAGTGGGLPQDYVYDVAADERGGVWALTPDAAARFDGLAWRTILQTSGRRVAIHPARSGDVWLGTDHYPYTLFRYNGASLDSFDLPGEQSGLRPFIEAITEDAEGRLWIGTDRYDAFRLDPSGWTAVPLRQGTVGAGARDILGDRDGGVWFSILDASGCTDADGNPCPLGLSRFDGSRWRPVGTRDGLPSAPSSPAGFPQPVLVDQIVQDSEGDLWFSTPVGLAHYEPDRAAPQTVITPASPPLLGTRSLTLGFVAAYGETRGIQFSYCIDGGPWSDWSTTNFWQGADLADGNHIFQVRARDEWDNVDPTPALHRFEVDATPPTPALRYPGQGAVVKGAISIQGAAADARFRSYRVDVRPAGAASWNPPVATPLAQSNVPVADGQLASWDTAAVPDGIYDLRVSVADSLGLVGIAQATVVVDNHFPYASETTPARVVAQTGGDVYTTGSEIHLYFPPRAFTDDALVTVTPLSAAAADTLPDGAVRIAPGWEIVWGAPDLRKPATLEVSYAGSAPPPGVPAVYVSSNGAAWSRLGGTVNPDAHTVSLPITRAGQYALFAESGVILGKGTLSGVSFTPRVFSPTGTFADRRVGIGFSLGRPGFVTVRVYSRSGRLIREVVANQWMNTGANVVHWDGIDRDGGLVTDGLYLVTVEALGLKQTKPLAVVK